MEDLAVTGGLLKQTLDRVLTPILRPFTRAFLGLVAVPLYRLVRHHVPGMGQFDKEFEKDVEQWFRGSLLLLLATKNFEMWAAGRLNLHFPDLLDKGRTGDNWLLMGGRLLLAIAVIEAMPDQELFAIIHPGPPHWKRDPQQSLWRNIRGYARPYLRGLGFQYLNRTAPVLAIMAVIFGGPKGHTVGWVCYGLAIVQYLIIGLITSRDMMFDVLARFDHQIARRRRTLIEEFDIDESKTSAPLDVQSAAAQHNPSPGVASGNGAQYDSTMESNSGLRTVEQEQAPGRQGADAP
jgi:hypothetical protein